MLLQFLDTLFVTTEHSEDCAKTSKVHLTSSQKERDAGIMHESRLIHKSVVTETPSMKPSILIRIPKVFHPDESTPSQFSKKRRDKRLNRSCGAAKQILQRRMEAYLFPIARILEVNHQ